MRWNARTVGVLAALALAVIALVWITFREAPVPVDLATVERGPMQVTITVDGKTRIRDVFEVAAPFAGVARRAPVEVGEPVTAGETVVAIVEPGEPALLDARTLVEAEAAVREAEAALHVAESDLRKAEEDAAYAQTQFERMQTLTERGAVSLTRLEDAAQRRAIADAALDAAESRRAMATSGLDRARAALITPTGRSGDDGDCCVRIPSPADGVVLTLDVVSETPVAAGQQLLSVGDPHDLEIVADLLSSDAVRVGPGTRALVERWGGDGTLEARLRQIEPVARTKVSALGIEEQRVDAVFDLVSPPEARPGLGHGFAVVLELIEWEAQDVLQVPLSAVFRSGGGWAVFTAVDGRARLTDVALGHRSETHAEVTSGLEAGDVLLLYPSDAVADGTAIAPRGEGEAAGR